VEVSTLPQGTRDEIASAAVQAVAFLRGRTLLTADELEQMTQPEVDAYLADFGIEIDWERIADDVVTAMGPDALAVDRGVAMSDERVERLVEKANRAGIIAARQAANKAMGDVRRQAMLEADPREPDEQWSQWAAVLGEKCCTDCQGLHGRKFKNDAWLGHEPRDGQTLCGGNCRCSLLPCASPGNENEGLKFNVDLEAA
jgi:hypothetical protein